MRPHTLSEPRPGPVLAAIQPSFAQHLKEDSEAADVRYARCLDLSQQALRGEKVDLLVWPETMWPFTMGEGQPGQEFTRGFGVDDVRDYDPRRDDLPRYAYRPDRIVDSVADLAELLELGNGQALWQSPMPRELVAQ